MELKLERKDIPVLLLTGYLGSGKTTLVNRILANKKGIKFAVIVNDIGEVNIDADLIQKGGVVGKTDDSLVALQNGCICCTLKMDLVEQLADIANMNRFDYIVIEASGICEPAPIAQTICSAPSLMPAYPNLSMPTLDCIVTVVDALRMKSEFDCGASLTEQNIDEEDIENLVIEQIEFCNTVLLNKASEVTKEELGKVRAIIHTLNPKAGIVECDHCDVDMDQIINTGAFDFEKVATSAAWINELEPSHEDKHEHKHEHEGGHHHHHHHDEGEAEEYGIGTYVYTRRAPFNMNKLDYVVSKKWPANIIRTKGLCFFEDDIDKCWLFEQAGTQKTIKDAGLWFAAMPEDELEQAFERDESLRKDWDEEFGDRIIKIVFIGQNLNRVKIDELMDFCLD